MVYIWEYNEIQGPRPVPAWSLYITSLLYICLEHQVAIASYSDSMQGLHASQHCSMSYPTAAEVSSSLHGHAYHLEVFRTELLSLIHI